MNDFFVYFFIGTKKRVELCQYVESTYNCLEISLYKDPIHSTDGWNVLRLFHSFPANEPQIKLLQMSKKTRITKINFVYFILTVERLQQTPALTYRPHNYIDTGCNFCWKYFAVVYVDRLHFIRNFCAHNFGIPLAMKIQRQPFIWAGCVSAGCAPASTFIHINRYV